jgi:hypothetical protein
VLEKPSVKSAKLSLPNVRAFWPMAMVMSLLAGMKSRMC